MQIELAKRIHDLAPYLFVELDKKKAAAIARGVDVISLTIGDPDLATPEAVVKAGQAAMAQADYHHYPTYNGQQEFRKEAASWMKLRYGVELCPDKEITAVIGTKEGIAHLPFALVDPDDIVLCPEPGYPVYAIATGLAGGKTHYMPLVAENNFLPDLDAIPKDVAQKAKLMWINYPNNPTAAIADKAFLQKAVDFAQEHQIVLAADCAYSEISFDGYQSPSVLELPGAKEVAVEFHSMSKTYNMTGWRIGFVAGQPEVVSVLGRLKSNLDSGAFEVVQQAAIAAMKMWPDCMPPILKTYQNRRDILVNGLKKIGYQPPLPKASFYVWMPVPGGDDVAFSAKLIEQVGVLVTPGSGFGPSGKGYVRFALTVGEDRMQEVVERIGKAGLI
jgi:LL-diaminopimelate aminotransferase